MISSKLHILLFYNFDEISKANVVILAKCEGKLIMARSIFPCTIRSDPNLMRYGRSGSSESFMRSTKPSFLIAIPLRHAWVLKLEKHLLLKELVKVY